MPTTPSARSVVFLAYDGAQLLDLSGPASVFSEANEFAPKPAYIVTVASPDGGVVATRGGVAVTSIPLAEVRTKIDTLVVCGGLGKPLQQVLGTPSVRSWFRRTAPKARRVASTCTGAFLLAAWGILDGHRATTHWQGAGQLQKMYPLVKVDADALFVQDGRIWTSAGVSTGIDMALAMVEQDLGRDVMLKVAQRLVLQAHRPGHQSQFSALLQAQAGRYAALVEWVEAHLDGDLSIAALSTRANQSPRTFQRRFQEELGTPPATFVERLRLDRARTLLEAGQSAKAVARAAGFETLDRLWRAFRRAYGLTPSTYRALHGRADQERGVAPRSGRLVD